MKENNKGSSSGSKSAPDPSNKGSTGGLRMESGTNQGATKKPTTKNPFPNGLA
jgi:hypothetical protein